MTVQEFQAAAAQKLEDAMSGGDPLVANLDDGSTLVAFNFSGEYQAEDLEPLKADIRSVLELIDLAVAKHTGTEYTGTLSAHIVERPTEPGEEN